MKYRKLIYALFLPLLGCMETVDKEKEKSELKEVKGQEIIFYNVENLFDYSDDPKTKDDAFLPRSKKRWTQDRFNKKIEGIAQVITEIASDFPILVGLVEIENKFCLDALISSDLLKKGNYDYVHKDSKDARGMDVSLLYREEFLEVITEEFLELKLGAHVYSRDIVYVQFRLANGESLHVYVNHWPSRREGRLSSEYKRMKAAELIRDHLDDLFERDENAKVLVMGDFNDYPNNNSLVKGLKSDSILDQLDSAELFNLAYKMHSRGLGTYYFRREWGMLDQMLVSQALIKADTGCAVDQENFGIFDADWLLYSNSKNKHSRPNRTYGGNKYYGGYSDHLPIYIKLN